MPVGHLGFQEAAEALDRIEFQTVGRQTQVGWCARVRWLQLEAGLVGDDPLDCGRFEA